MAAFSPLGMERDPMMKPLNGHELKRRKPNFAQS